MELGSLPVKVSINGRPPRDLEARTIAYLLVETAADTSGQIRDAGATARAYLWRSLREGAFYWLLGGSAFVVLLLIADVPPRPTGWAIVLFVAFAIGLPIGAAVRIGRGVEWYRALAQYLAPLPPAGTRIQVTEDGVTIGPTHTPWQSLRLEEAGLREFYAPNFYRWRARVDRLKLATRDGSVVLDPIAIESGQAIVDTIWRRLGMPR
jgi:hypothetical protein